jgi:hypothetical protein
LNRVAQADDLADIVALDILQRRVEREAIAMNV